MIKLFNFRYIDLIDVHLMQLVVPGVFFVITKNEHAR